MPYLRNAWYLGAWSGEVGEAPLGRKLLDEHVVLYRDSRRRVVALDGRCPHRFAPLRLGRVVGDAIECGYHGLRFGADGRCIHQPHGDRAIPQRAQLKTYEVVERDGAIWLWMGDPDRVDPATIIDTGFVTDPGYATVSGHLQVRANYRLVIDNLLDLTHPAYLHRGGLSSEEYQGEKMQHRFRQEGTTIHSDYSFHDVHPSPALKAYWAKDKCDVRAFMRLEAPTNLLLDFRMGEVDGDPDCGVFLPTLHLVVPESEDSTHYFFAMGRNVDIDNQEASRMIGLMAQRAFAEEDEPMIRACQEMMGTDDLFALQPILLKTDVAAVRARLLLDKLIRQEQAGADAAPAPGGRSTIADADEMPVP